MRKLLLGLFFGLLTQAALAQAPSSLPGCQYNATPPTLSDKQTTVWQCDINGKLITSGGGNVVGPASSTDNAIVRWDGTTGTLVQNSLVTIDDTGTLTAPNLVTTLANGGLFVRNDSGAIGLGVSDDVLIKRAAAASLQLGATDGAAPVAQTLGVQSVVAGTANTAGANFTIAGSKSTGSAAGGSIIFQTAAAGGAGSGQNALATALTINSIGQLIAGLGTAALPTITPIGDVTSGLWWASTTNLSISVSGVERFRFGSGGLATDIGGYSIGTSVGSPDVFLIRDAANTLALRNSTTAQGFNIYKSFVDASNYSRLDIGNSADSGTNYIYGEAAGSGVGHDLLLGMSTVHSILFYTAATQRWTISGAGHFLATNDNTYDIGASGATRPRNLYVGTDATIGGTMLAAGIAAQSAANIYWVARSVLAAPSDGVIRLTNNAATDFTRLQFGGTTSSFPAIARNGIKLEAKLADDSTYASFAARGLIVAGAVPTLTLAGGTCAGTAIAGGSTAGTVTLTGVCVATNTMALTVMPTAPTGYACDAIDRTLGSSLLTETATTTTSVTFTFGGTTGATDVLAYKCLAY